MPCSRCEGKRLVYSPKWEEYHTMVRMLQNDNDVASANEYATLYIPKVPEWIPCPECSAGKDGSLPIWVPSDRAVAITSTEILHHMRSVKFPEELVVEFSKLLDAGLSTNILLSAFAVDYAEEKG